MLLPTHIEISVLLFRPIIERRAGIGLRGGHAFTLPGVLSTETCGLSEPAYPTFSYRVVASWVKPARSPHPRKPLLIVCAVTSGLFFSFWKPPVGSLP